MNINEFIGIDSFGKDKQTGFDVGHEEKYQRIIFALGYEEVKKCIPFSRDKIVKALKTDKYLNNLSMKLWDAESGIYVNNHTGKATITGSRLVELYRKHGINCFSQSDGVCILKNCARMWANEQEVKQ